MEEQALVDDAVAGRPLSAAPHLDAIGVGTAYEQVLATAGQRKALGAFYTPSPVIEFLLDQTLQPMLDQARSAADVGRIRVLDPSCGVGLFLVAARRRIGARLAELGSTADPAVGLCGVDVDPVAANLAQALLPGARIHTADALLDDPLGQHTFDVVVGNPPFLNRLRRGTAPTPSAAARIAALTGTAAYTDLSAVFLARSVHWARPHGRVGMVQPVSVLAARDAAPVRRQLQRRLRGVWVGGPRTFDAGVHACAVVLGAESEVPPMLWRADFTEAGAHRLSGDSWAPLLARSNGVPPVEVAGEGVLGDLAECAADFRDQYYGLVGYVHESSAAHLTSDRVRLVTSGLIEPGRSMWGQRSTRFAKQRYLHPVVEVDQLPAQMSAWARQRLVPKVLLATQGRVLEAVVDQAGEWLPSVPVISVVPHAEEDLWRILAVLCAPPVTAWAAMHHAGAGMHPQAIKLSARQTAALPLPQDRRAWDQAATQLRESDGSLEAIEAAGRSMCQAYDVPIEPVWSWWRDRLSRP